MLHPRAALSRILPLLTLALLGFVGTAGAQIVAFGASNVSGWNVAASEAFPAQLQSMLRAKGYDVKVLNAGIYGNTTSQMRSRMDTDIPEGTTLVILDVSGGLYNGSRQGLRREQGDADLAAIRTRLTERHIAIIAFSGAAIPAPYHQEDGVHLTPEGHRLAAANLMDEVTQTLGPPPPPVATRSVREACVADARRLCAAVLADADKRHQCMQEHRAELSKDCLHALSASRKQQSE